MCPFKSCQPESNRGKECSGALTKPDAPAYAPSHTCSLLLSLAPLALSLHHRWNRELGRLLPQAVCSTSSSLWTTFSVVWLPGHCLCPNLLIVLSGPLCLSVFMLGRPFPHPPPPPQSSLAPVTHTHAQGMPKMGLFHSLSCTSSSGSTASTLH